MVEWRGMGAYRAGVGMETPLGANGNGVVQGVRGSEGPTLLGFIFFYLLFLFTMDTLEE